MNILPLLLLTLGFAVFVFPLYLAISDLSEHVLNPPKPSTRKSAPHELVFPKYEHQLYMQKLKKRRQLRQRFFHI